MNPAATEQLAYTLQGLDIVEEEIKELEMTRITLLEIRDTLRSELDQAVSTPGVGSGLSVPITVREYSRL